MTPGEVEELTFGCGYPEGATGGNVVARHTAFRARLPASSAASMVSRFCASGLEAIASAARRVVVDGFTVCVAGGLESISLVQPHANRVHLRNAWLGRNKPGVCATIRDSGPRELARANGRRRCSTSNDRPAAAAPAPAVPKARKVK